MQMWWVVSLCDALFSSNRLDVAEAALVFNKVCYMHNMHMYWHVAC